MSVLEQAFRLRAAQRAPLQDEYRAIMQRFDAPHPADPARLLELITALGLTDSDVHQDAMAIQDLRVNEMPLATLNQTRDAISRRIKELEGKLAETPKPSHNFRYGGPPTENDRRIDAVAAIEKQIDAMRDEAHSNRLQIELTERKITDIKWRFPRVFGVK